MKDSQFERAINEGVISLLGDEHKESICKSYTLISRATRRMHAYINQAHEDIKHGDHKANTFAALKEAKISIEASISKLNAFLGSQTSS